MEETGIQSGNGKIMISSQWSCKCFDFPAKLHLNKRKQTYVKDNNVKLHESPMTSLECRENLPVYSAEQRNKSHTDKLFWQSDHISQLNLFYTIKNKTSLI